MYCFCHFSIPATSKLASEKTNATVHTTSKGSAGTMEGGEVSKPPIEPVRSGRSYFVALSYWEQLMASTTNFMQFQCYVKTLGPHFSTIEPHIQAERSVWGFSFGNERFSNISLSQVYNMDTWYKLWPNYNPKNLAPIVSKQEIEDELTRFNKDVVFIIIRHRPCKFDWNITSDLNDLERYKRLNVTRRICANLENYTSVADFNKMIFGGIPPRDTLFILKEWRGVGHARSNINIPSCFRLAVYSEIQPSIYILEDAERYANKYLGGFGQYISVSARFEKISRTYWLETKKKLRGYVGAAIKEAMTTLNALKENNSVERVYLAYDFGKFGSRTFEINKFYNSSDLLIKFQEDLYEGRLNHSAYEQSFMTLKYQNRGYIAMVQMILSSKGKCLLKIGWGFCIDFVTTLFKTNHQKPYCIECAPRKIC